jgi:hypothetical protein
MNPEWCEAQMIRLVWITILAIAIISFGPLPRTQNNTSPPQTNPQGKDHVKSDCADENRFSHCFSLVKMADGVTADHFVYSENTYTGPDGEEVYFRTVHYTSRERAAQEFEDIQKSAIKVSDHAKTVNDDGQEDKLAVLELAGNPQRDGSIIIALVGKNFRSTQSKSLEDILLLANQMKEHAKSK